MTRFTRVNVSIAQFPEATLISARPLNLCFIVVFPGCLLVQLENMQMSVDQITSPYYFLSQHSALVAFHIEMCFSFSASLLQQQLTVKCALSIAQTDTCHWLHRPGQTHATAWANIVWILKLTEQWLHLEQQTRQVLLVNKKCSSFLESNKVVKTSSIMESVIFINIPCILHIIFDIHWCHDIQMTWIWKQMDHAWCP